MTRMPRAIVVCGFPNECIRGVSSSETMTDPTVRNTTEWRTDLMSSMWCG